MLQSRGYQWPTGGWCLYTYLYIWLPPYHNLSGLAWISLHVKMQAKCGCKIRLLSIENGNFASFWKKKLTNIRCGCSKPSQHCWKLDKAQSDLKCEFHFLTLSLVTGKARELLVVVIESPVLAALVIVSNSIYWASTIKKAMAGFGPHSLFRGGGCVGKGRAFADLRTK